jgi:hypothetical protein
MGFETELSRLIANQSVVSEMIAAAGSIPVTIHIDGCDSIIRDLEAVLAGI